MVTDPRVHQPTVEHMADCRSCRHAEWERRGGHPALTGATKARPPEAVAWGPNTMNPKVDRFLETGDPSGL